MTRDGETSTILDAVAPMPAQDRETDALVAETSAVDHLRVLKLGAHEFVVVPGVYSPLFFDTSEAFFRAHVLPRVDGDLLEIGPGVGILAVLAAQRGRGRVVGVDINPDAVRNTRVNAVLHGVEDRVEALLGDVYAPVAGRTFDVIAWNAPFSYSERDDLTALERAVYDPGYAGLITLFAEGRRHLAPGGRLLVGFSDTHGHRPVIDRLAAAHGWTVETLARQEAPEGDTILSQLVIEARPTDEDGPEARNV